MACFPNLVFFFLLQRFLPTKWNYLGNSCHLLLVSGYFLVNLSIWAVDGTYKWKPALLVYGPDLLRAHFEEPFFRFSRKIRREVIFAGGQNDLTVTTRYVFWVQE